MEMTYRPLLPPTQFCPCEFEKFSATQLKSLPHSRRTSPFYRSLFASYSPLWINSNPARKDNSSDPASPEQAAIDYRLTFERQKKAEARYWDSTAYFASLYMPKGRWQWTHQVTFENRPEEVRISCNQRYTLGVKTAQVYQESITYISKLWPRERKWDGFPREVWLHKTQLRSIHGVAIPALIGVHTNIDGIQMTYDVPHHSFWIQASPDMPDVLKRRCFQAYDQLHCQGVLHGMVELESILIGGDGRVKIMNFDRSRSSKPHGPVHLEPATQEDFKLEMREVHFKLDYMDARRKERLLWENRDNPQADQPPADPTTKIHAKYPYSVTREVPVDPAQWVLPELWRPKRFVVPGQSVQQFQYHLRQFLLAVDEEAGEGMDPPQFKSKKRKRGDRDEDSSDITSRKRPKVRFNPEATHHDGIRHTTRRLAPSPPPGLRRVVPRLSREWREANGDTSSYGPNVSPLDSCPHIPPLFDRHGSFPWESSRAEHHGRQNARHVCSVDGNNSESERARGKRRQLDIDNSSAFEDAPRAKRLRRTETTLTEPVELNNSTAAEQSESSSTQQPPVDSPRYSLRSSSRRTQVNSRTSRPSSSRAAQQTTGSGSSTSMRRRVRAPNDTLESIPLSPISTNSRTPPTASTFTSTNSVSSHGSTSALNTSTQARNSANQLTSATAMIVSGGAGITQSSFGPIQVVTYDQLALYQPLQPRSTIETVRLVAEQIPNTLLTTATRIARTFRLW